MRHVTFDNIKGTTNILVDHISRLRSMDLYDMLNAEERGKQFEDIMFDELFPITIEQEGATVSVNQIQHVFVNLDDDEIKGLQKEIPRTPN